MLGEVAEGRGAAAAPAAIGELVPALGADVIGGGAVGPEDGSDVFLFAARRWRPDARAIRAAWRRGRPLVC